jgi:hypothetical protein
MCVYVLIGVSARTYISICVCTVFLKKITNAQFVMLDFILVVDFKLKKRAKTHLYIPWEFF